MRSIKLQLRLRFMKLYRLFRHKKYGEPIEPLKEEKINVEKNSNTKKKRRGT
jgi:hypothetical protein